MNSTKNSSYMSCRDECKKSDDCTWFSYSASNNSTCLLYTACAEKDNDISWISSQKECKNNQCYIPVKCVESVRRLFQKECIVMYVCDLGFFVNSIHCPPPSNLLTKSISDYDHSY